MGHDAAPAPAPSGGAHDRDFTAAWHAALDDLELEVQRAEQLLHDLHQQGPHDAVPATPWVPPATGGPLPDSLRERAQHILDRQLAVSGRLATAMTSSRKHLDVVDRLVEPPAARPMYVDARL